MNPVIHMKTQDLIGDLYPNPSGQSRNVATVSNPEDRQAPSFDDLFEDPDQVPATQSPQPPSPAASNVNVIDAVGSPLDDLAVEPAVAEVAEVVEATDQTADALAGGPEFVAPMEEFNSGFMAPVVDEVPAPTATTSGGRLYRSSGAEGPAAAIAIPARDVLPGAGAGRF